jgi:SnoaL-like domain
MDLAWLVAHEQIRQLASRYAMAINHRDLESLVLLFVPNVQVGRDRFGREALHADFDRQLRASGVSILQVTNHVIDLDSHDAAHGIVSCRAEVQIGDTWIVQQIEYHDTYALRDDEWLFVRRKHLLYYGADINQVPLGLPDANWPQSQTGQGTLPFSLPSWQRFWDEGNADPS